MPTLRAGTLPWLICSSSIRWICNNLRHFDPFANSPLAEDLRHQALAELSLLCLLLRRDEAIRSLPELAKVMTFVAGLNTNALFEASLCRWNNAIVPVVILAVTLEAYGLTAENDRRVMIQKALRNTNACIVERVPYRQLELRHILDAGGFAHNLPTYRELWSRTLLAQRPNLLFLSDEDVYSITHVLFYVSDFSARKIEFLAPQEIDYVHDAVCHLVGVYLRRKNWDLVGELLMAERCLRKTSRFSVMAWRHLMEAQHPDGRMDGPYLEKLADHERDEEHLFETCYHTTLVSALASAVGRRRDQPSSAMPLSGSL